MFALLPKSLQFLFPFGLDQVEVLVLLDSAPDRIASDENIDGQFFPLVFIRRIEPTEMVRMRSAKSLQKGQSHPVGSEPILVGYV